VGPNGTIECPATPVFSTPTASDLCDPNPTLTHNDVITPGTCPQEYSVTRTWTATDACGNSSTASQTINVTDDTAPVISGVGPNGTIECPAAPVFSSPSATDLCDPAPSLTFNDVTTPGSCPQEYSVTRTWTATDACGNSSTASQTINVTDDTAPVISGVGQNGSVECPAAPVFSTPTASDLCDPNPTITHNDVTTPGACPQEYSVTRTWTATDACGNSSTASQSINVTDDTAPVISGVGPNGTIECPAAPVFSSPSATSSP
jgi:N-acetylmuramoyl-L-alanine amidase CwlA